MAAIIQGLERTDILLDLSAEEIDYEIDEAWYAYDKLLEANVRVAGADANRAALFANTAEKYRRRIELAQDGINAAQMIVSTEALVISNEIGSLALPANVQLDAGNPIDRSDAVKLTEASDKQLGGEPSNQAKNTKEVGVNTIDALSEQGMCNGHSGSDLYRTSYTARRHTASVDGDGWICQP